MTTEAGLIATITDGGVTMHGHLAEGATYEQRAAFLYNDPTYYTPKSVLL